MPPFLDREYTFPRKKRRIRVESQKSSTCFAKNSCTSRYFFLENRSTDELW